MGIKIKTPDKRQIVSNALKKADITSLDGWAVLEELSSRTDLDGVEYFEDEITLKDNEFSGPINVYVVLNYGDKGDMATMSGAFPGSIQGHFEGQNPKIDRIVVDTSSFYE